MWNIVLLFTALVVVTAEDMEAIEEVGLEEVMVEVLVEVLADHDNLVEDLTEAGKNHFLKIIYNL